MRACWPAATAVGSTARARVPIPQKSLTVLDREYRISNLSFRAEVGTGGIHQYRDGLAQQLEFEAQVGFVANSGEVSKSTIVKCPSDTGIERIPEPKFM